MVETYVEKRRRGFFGRLFLVVFWLWQGIMLLWLVGYLREVAPMVTDKSANEWERAGSSIGVTFGVTFLAFWWVVGSIILGLMVFFSRGQKRLIRVDEPKA